MNTIYNESILFLGDEGVALLYSPLEISSVTYMGQELELNIDYRFENGKLYHIQGGKAPHISLEEYYPTSWEQDKTFYRKNDGEYILFRNDSYFHEHQVYVTYTTNEIWAGPQIKNKSELLKRTKGKKDIHLVAIGDSITCGGNVSGMYDIAPHTPIWVDVVSEKMGALSYKNLAKGGECSSWAVKNFESFDIAPVDLMIIAFGMNDGTQRVMPTEFSKNIQFLIDGVRKINSNTEFVLVAPMLPNEEVYVEPGKSFMGYQREYLQELLKLEGEGIIVADMTSIHEYLLTKKRYVDMTGNNVNHQNDYLSEVYADVILKTMGVI